MILIVIGVLRKAGFAVSHRKIKVLGSGDAKILHNLVMSRAARVSRSYLWQTRSGIHKLRTGAIASRNKARYVRALRGRIRYIAAFSPDIGERLRLELDGAISRTASRD